MRLLTAVALGVGVLVRVIPVLSSPLPLGDGGLIAVLTNDIRSAGLVIPTATTYNELGIPFAYPPGALWLSAAITELLGASTLEALRWIPLVVGVACLVAFAAVARAMLPSVAAAGAVATYALMPHAFDWVIAGGGLTRGLGLLPALLAMWLTAGRAPSTRRAVAVGALLGASGLMHPQTPVFGVIGVLVIWVTSTPPRAQWGQVLAAAAVALVVTAAWLVPMWMSTGTLPVLSAGHRWSPLTGVVRMTTLEFSGAAFMDLLSPLAVVGLATSLLRAAWRLPALVLLVYLASPGGGEFMAAVAWSLLAGVGFELVWSALAAARPSLGRLVAVPVASVGLFIAVTSAIGAGVHEQSKLHAVTDEQLEAMQWTKAESPDGAAFLVATIDAWGNDEVSEWFPALAERRSLGTVQGSEWLGPDGFERQEDVHFALVDCIGATAACYATVAEGAGEPDAWIFIPKGQLAGPLSASDCCPALRATLPDAGYEIVYDAAGATIARPAR